jgi:phosphatidyl-myo-inositol dimannoside synthase
MAHRPRLLILTPDFPPAPGGIQLMAHRFASTIQGFETKIIALDAPAAKSFDEESRLAVRRVGARGLPRSGRTAILNAVALADALRFRPDVTLSMHSVASPAASAIRRALGARTVQYFHAEEVATRPKLAIFAAQQADVVIAVSDYTAGLIAATGAAPGDMRLIPPGVDIPSDPSPLPVDRPTLLTVARMEERYKGHDMLVRALVLVRAKVPDVQWIVIGDGSLRTGVEQLAGSYGVSDSIRFLGAVEDEVRDAWLRRTNLLAMASRLPAEGYAGEGFGIVFLEAGAYGKPVVAGHVGGALDAVADGESGLLVDPLDPVAVAEAIAALLLDGELAARLGRAAQRRAQSFAWPKIAARVQEVLLEQIESSS